MSTLVDLSHIIEHGMVTFRGLPAPVLSDHLDRARSRTIYADGAEFHIGRIDMVGATGTYVDVPWHRYEHGQDLTETDLSRLADLPAVRISASERALGPELFAGLDLAGKAVLLHTGWDALWRTPAYFDENPFLTEAGARALVEKRVTLVGIDSANLDDMQDLKRPAHSALLAVGIVIVEHLCGLGQLPPSGFRFFAVPAKVRGMGSWPVRAFAKVD